MGQSRYQIDRAINILKIVFRLRERKTACNIGFAARLAGHWSNGHFIAVVLHLGWTYIAGLLFVNLYFYIFNQQQFRADTATIPALQQALPVACYVWTAHDSQKLIRPQSITKTFEKDNFYNYFSHCFVVDILLFQKYLWLDGVS